SLERKRDHKDLIIVVVPQPVNYNRPPSLHNPDLYADAYAALGRGGYEATARAPNNNKV
ncbi:hypothetical protein FF38_00478, partial [Lucilia cuprina]